MELSVSILNSVDRIRDIDKLNNIKKVDYIHYDVMDNIFVCDKQFDFNELNTLFNVCNVKKDVHLMVSNPYHYIKFLSRYDIEYITIHSEIKDCYKYIKLIKGYKKKVGIAINPTTNIEKIIPYLDSVDLVLVMSVVPGKGGQQFIPSSIDKIKYLDSIIKKNNYNIKIEVDGGINDTNIELLRDINVGVVVVGSFITNSDDFIKQIDKIK